MVLEVVECEGEGLSVPVSGTQRVWCPYSICSSSYSHYISESFGNPLTGLYTYSRASRDHQMGKEITYRNKKKYGEEQRASQNE